MRGEEVLQHWRPHGVGLVDILKDGRRKAMKESQVAGTEAILENLHEQHLLSMPRFDQEGFEHDLLQRAVELWQKYDYTRSEVRTSLRSRRSSLT